MNERAYFAQVIKFKAQGVNIDMLFCSLHYAKLPSPCNVHVEVRCSGVAVEKTKQCFG